MIICIPMEEWKSCGIMQEFHRVGQWNANVAELSATISSFLWRLGGSDAVAGRQSRK